LVRCHLLYILFPTLTAGSWPSSQIRDSFWLSTGRRSAVLWSVYAGRPGSSPGRQQDHSMRLKIVRY
jgi:hypothetical protein